MSSQDTARRPITLVTPKLSEPEYSGTGRGQSFLDKLDIRTRLLLAGLSVAVLAVSALVLYFSYQVSPQKLTPLDTIQAQQNSGPESQVRANGELLAPFASSNFEKSKNLAEQSLSSFVEANQALQKIINVEVLSLSELADAQDIALRGDELFLENDFAGASERYLTALEIVETATGQGKQRLAELSDELEKSIDSLAVERANRLLAEAVELSAQPDSLEKLSKRVKVLPDVAEALREARNFELADRYSEALSVYRKIADLDPLTDGLDQFFDRADQKRSEQLLKRDIGFGMYALARGNLDEAEKYFASAQLLSPENETVLAGLRYKNQLKESISLADRRKAAVSAVTSEEWGEAIKLYRAVLDSHPFSTFAIEGIRDTLKLQELTDQLEIIVSQPEKLSDEELFAQATDVFRSAERLLDTTDKVKLPNFRSLTTQVKGLLNRYTSPVSVTLYSDDATEISISGVGSLGRFQQTTIELNVGEQTFRGIQNGCRDVYRTVIVEPGMRPIDIRCEERISR